VLRWLEDDGHVSVFRAPPNYTNGNTRDREGRLISCEHDTHRVTRTELDGGITVLIDRFQAGRTAFVLCRLRDFPWRPRPYPGVQRRRHNVAQRPRVCRKFQPRHDRRCPLRHGRQCLVQHGLGDPIACS
jgi:hypothetical protein